MRGQWQGEQWWQELDSPRRKEEWPAGRGVVRKGRSVGASAQRPEIRVSERTEQGGTCPNSRRRERKEQTWPPPDGRRESQASSSKQVKAESLGVSLLGQHSLPGGHHRAAGGRGQWEIHSEEGFSEPWGQRLSHQGPGYSRLLCYVQEGGKGKRIRQPRPQGRQSLAVHCRGQAWPPCQDRVSAGTSLVLPWRCRPQGGDLWANGTEPWGPLLSQNTYHSCPSISFYQVF